MKLVDLSIGKSNREKVEYNGAGSGRVVVFLYLNCLGRKYDADCGKVAVTITNDPKIYKDRIINLIDYIEIYEHFDFDKFNGLGKYEKKKMMLDTLQSALLRTAKEFNWSTAELYDAYNCCIERQLICEWYREKDKYFLSPDKKYYARLFGSMDSDLLEFFIIFYDKSKKELKRVKIFQDNPCFYDSSDIGDIGWVKDGTLTFRVSHRFRKNTHWEAKINE